MGPVLTAIDKLKLALSSATMLPAVELLLAALAGLGLVTIWNGLKSCGRRSKATNPASPPESDDDGPQVDRPPRRARRNDDDSFGPTQVAIKGHPPYYVYHTTMCSALQAVKESERKYIKHCHFCAERIRISKSKVE